MLYLLILICFILSTPLWLVNTIILPLQPRTKVKTPKVTQYYIQALLPGWLALESKFSPTVPYCLADEFLKKVLVHRNFVLDDFNLQNCLEILVFHQENISRYLQEILLEFTDNHQRQSRSQKGRLGSKFLNFRLIAQHSLYLEVKSNVFGIWYL